jgi:GMP synthase (glutamine-hydrolysing)
VARAIRPTVAGRAHPLLDGRPAEFEAFTSHADHVSVVPPGAAVLAGNDWSPVQALAVEGPAPFWAVQYHPEYDPREVARLALLREDELLAQGRFPDAAALRTWVRDMEALQAQPGRADLRRRLGVGEGLLDPARREVEVRNWLDRVARPRAAHRA